MILKLQHKVMLKYVSLQSLYTKVSLKISHFAC